MRLKILMVAPMLSLSLTGLAAQTTVRGADAEVFFQAVGFNQNSVFQFFLDAADGSHARELFAANGSSFSLAGGPLTPFSSFSVVDIDLGFFSAGVPIRFSYIAGGGTYRGFGIAFVFPDGPEFEAISNREPIGSDQFLFKVKGGSSVVENIACTRDNHVPCSAENVADAVPVVPSPEPSTLGLMATGLLAIGAASARRKRSDGAKANVSLRASRLHLSTIVPSICAFSHQSRALHHASRPRSNDR